MIWEGRKERASDRGSEPLRANEPGPARGKGGGRGGENKNGEARRDEGHSPLTRILGSFLAASSELLRRSCGGSKSKFPG